MRMNALAIAVGGALIASPAAAFDAWGFHSGMTIDEAKRAALPGQVVVRFAADLLEVNRLGTRNLAIVLPRSAGFYGKNYLPGKAVGGSH